MRIALLHSYYSSAQSSGENVVVDAQFQALSAAGHDVMLLGRRTDTEQALSGYQVRAAWRTLTNRGPNPFDRLRRFEPDVVHVHNTVPNIGLTWLPRWRGPVVHTLHNFRPLCANGLLFRDGRVCTDCPDGRPWSAVEHGCYRNSALASTPIAARNSQGVAVNPLLNRADALILLSAYARDVFTRYGVDRHKVHLLPNGVRQIHTEAVVEPPEQRWIAVGRLRAEKGFVELLRGWPEGVGLDIAGTGPQRGELEALAGESVRFLGQVPATELRRMLPSYTGMVFTSLAPESAMPLVVVEALEAGIPVAIVASSPHASELITRGVAFGLAVDARAVRIDSILEALAWAYRGGESLRSRCRELYEEQYGEATWVARLTALYAELLRTGAGRSRAPRTNARALTNQPPSVAASPPDPTSSPELS